MVLLKMYSDHIIFFMNTELNVGTGKLEKLKSGLII